MEKMDRKRWRRSVIQPMGQEDKLLLKALKRDNPGRPPVWFMRQAGRYHSHYQQLRLRHSFDEICKQPELSSEAALGPIRDFDFDAAILFSDILFILDSIGMKFEFSESGPRSSWFLEDYDQVSRLKDEGDGAARLSFQYESIYRLKRALPVEKALLGFVGAPLTLFFFAVLGRHVGDISKVIGGFQDGRFASFADKLFETLVSNMVLQAEAGADAIAMFDSCAGDIPFTVYRETVVPFLQQVVSEFKKVKPAVPLIYYAKNAGRDHRTVISGLPVACLGIDWKQPLNDVLMEYANSYSIQGNIDPSWLLLPPDEMTETLRQTFSSVKTLPKEKCSGWICGLGHGVRPDTPEANVRLFVQTLRETFAE